MRILVTGREGQVARALLNVAGGDVVIDALGRPELDVTDRASIDLAIRRLSPDILVNAAAYTAVDKAETDEASAFAVNGQGAGNAAAAAATAGIPIIHVSTDYVFSGDKEDPYREDDPTRPINVYGRSKLAGEQAVIAANLAHVILRTSWVYAPWGSNFVRTMLRLAAERDTVRVVADQWGAPTYAIDIAEGILTVARTALGDAGGEAWRGIFHMTAAGATNWASFAEAIFSASAARGGPTSIVEPITAAEYPTCARRPANSLLDNTKFHATFGHDLPEWRSGAIRSVAELCKCA
jgi:dTDP-4-dehydrorhamnose reductase